MRKELLFNPRLLIERLSELSLDKRRYKKLKNTIASRLELSQIASLEFFEIAKKDCIIKTVYDLGANVGTWTMLAHVLLPGSIVHAFEPIPGYQDNYMHNTKGLPGVTLHKVAAGQENKKEKFNFAGHSSSFLEVSENLTKIFPSEKKTAEYIVDMVRLDDYVRNNNIPYPEIMKLDVEGYELEVLKNGTECMKHCKYIILEVSFIERHIGQPLFHEVVQFMAENNFLVCAFPKRMHLGTKIQMTDIMFENKKFSS